MTTRKDGLTSGKTEDVGKDRLWYGLTTLTNVFLVTSNTEKDSPRIHREGGVEDGSTWIDLTDNDQGMERTRLTEQRVNTVCVQCNREFGTLHGLKVHQGKTCLKKKRQCGSSDRKTRSKSSQDENHSGSIMVSVNSPSTQALS